MITGRMLLTLGRLFHLLRNSIQPDRRLITRMPEAKLWKSLAGYLLLLAFSLFDSLGHI